MQFDVMVEIAYGKQILIFLVDASIHDCVLSIKMGSFAPGNTKFFLAKKGQ